MTRLIFIFSIIINLNNIFISCIIISFSSKILSLKYEQFDDKKNEESRPKIYKCSINSNKDEKMIPQLYKH